MCFIKATQDSTIMWKKKSSEIMCLVEAKHSMSFWVFLSAGKLWNSLNVFLMLALSWINMNGDVFIDHSRYAMECLLMRETCTVLVSTVALTKILLWNDCLWRHAFVSQDIIWSFVQRCNRGICGNWLESKWISNTKQNDKLLFFCQYVNYRRNGNEAYNLPKKQ